MEKHYTIIMCETRLFCARTMKITGEALAEAPVFSDYRSLMGLLHQRRVLFFLMKPKTRSIFLL
jgi:hypothetical protein